MTHGKPRSYRRVRRAFRSVALWSAVALLACWCLSFQTQCGVGIHTRPTWGWGPSKSNVELSLVRGGLLCILGGTRTDCIGYDSRSGYSTFGDTLYFLEVDTPGRAVIWWPRFTRPAPWSGTYDFYPFWLLIAPCAALVGWLRPRPRTDDSVCRACGYPRPGLPSPLSPCPECGAVPPGEPSAS